MRDRFKTVALILKLEERPQFNRTKNLPALWERIIETAVPIFIRCIVFRCSLFNFFRFLEFHSIFFCVTSCKFLIKAGERQNFGARFAVLKF